MWDDLISYEVIYHNFTFDSSNDLSQIKPQCSKLYYPKDRIIVTIVTTEKNSSGTHIVALEFCQVPKTCLRRFLIRF